MAIAFTCIRHAPQVNRVYKLSNQIVATAACARNSNIHLTQHYLATHVFELQLQEAHH